MHELYTNIDLPGRLFCGLGNIIQSLGCFRKAFVVLGDHFAMPKDILFYSYATLKTIFLNLRENMILM